MRLRSILPHGKKGLNDLSILMAGLTILFFTGAYIEFFNEGFNTSFDEFDSRTNVENTREEAANTTSFRVAFSVLFNVVKLALWDPSNSLQLPWFLDLFYTLVAIAMIVALFNFI